MAVPRDFIDKKKIYPAANECIYCGARDVPLTDEHTFSDGLGGRHVFPRASCKSCAKIINEEFEQYCQRTLFANMRALLGMRSSKKKRPPLPTSVRVRRHDGRIDRVYAEPAELPRFFTLPVFPEPCFITGEPVSDMINGAIWTYQPEALDPMLAAYDAKDFITEMIWPNKVARLVAKIAHSHGRAVLGPTFEPLLVPIILGQNKRFNEFVGGWVKHLDPVEGLTHTLRIFTHHKGDDVYAVAAIRFFALFGGPVYYAVIGRMTAPWPIPKQADE